MHSISKQAIVAYSAEKMYSLVSDVNSYPLFLNWCQSAQVVSANDTEVHAYIRVSKGPFKQKFSTKNTLIHNRSITMKLLDGPFKFLEGKWQFIPLDENSCKVLFNLEFSFNTKLLDITLSSYFKQITHAQLEAFIARAKEIYE